MIVKDEAPVIRRCLESVLPLIDAWAICDTGSSDDTPEIVEQTMAGVSGKLAHHEWQDFAANRNKALDLARQMGCDYILFIDADEELMYPNDVFRVPKLVEDCYELHRYYGRMEYWRAGLVRSALPWRWEGVLHEYLACDEMYHSAKLDWPRVRAYHEGARSRDPETYKKDIALLKKALRNDPGNTRYTYYLAQSLRDAAKPAQARLVYLDRAGMGGWEEEAWHAQYQAAKCLDRMGQDPTREYLAAYQRRPGRAEPLYHAARWNREHGNLALATMLALQATMITDSADRLFVERDVYEWRALDEFAVSAYYVPHMKAAGRVAAMRLLGITDDPRVRKNAAFYGVA